MIEQCSTCKYCVAIWNYGMFGCGMNDDYNTVNGCNSYEPNPSCTVTSTSGTGIMVKVEDDL